METETSTKVDELAESCSKRRHSRSIRRKSGRGSDVVIGWQRNRERAESKTATLAATSSANESLAQTSVKQNDSGNNSKPKRSQASENRRRKRKEIIMGWQRNPTFKQSQIAGLVLVKEKAEPESQERFQESSSDREKKKPQSKRLRPREADYERKECSREMIKYDSKEDIPQRATTIQSRHVARKPAHLRVYDGTIHRGERPRSRSRGARYSETKKRKEEKTMQRTLEIVTKESATDGMLSEPVKVDKKTLTDAAEELARRQSYESDKLHTVGTVKGRRNANGGSFSRKETSTRRRHSTKDPCPNSHAKKVHKHISSRAEVEVIWQREPSLPARNSSRSRGTARKSRPNKCGCHAATD